MIGVTDSVKYPGTNSFERFEYPSALPAGAAGRARAGWPSVLVPAHGLDACFFNIEFFVPDGRPSADRGAEPAHRLAVRAARRGGARPARPTTRSSRSRAARIPPGTAARRTASRSPTSCACSRTRSSRRCPSRRTGSRSSFAPGCRLSEQGTNDTASYRLAIFTEWGETREDALQPVPSSERGRFGSALGRGRPRPLTSAPAKASPAATHIAAWNASAASASSAASGRPARTGCRRRRVDERDDDAERRDGHQLSEARDRRVDARRRRRSSPPAPASVPWT